jgi:AraC family transcriptional regulator
MADYLRAQTLFRGSLVAVYDLSCHAPCGNRSAEEQSVSHSIVFPRSGVFIKQISERDQLVAEWTRILFFNRHETYRVSHPITGGDNCTTIDFEADALVHFLCSMDSSIAELPDRPFRVSATTSSAPLALNLHRLRRLLLTGQSVDPLRVEESCASMLADSIASVYRRRRIMRKPIREVTRQAHRDLIDRTRIVLARRFRDKLSLGELAQAVFSSPFHLARIFRRETGMSLHGQQNRLRLRLALEHLAAGKPDLTMLALELGFSSHSHFTQAFRSEFGCAPSAFNQQLSSRGFREVRTLLKLAHATNGHQRYCC